MQEEPAMTQEELFEISREAMTNLAKPVKLTWKNINFTVKVRNTGPTAWIPEERYKDFQVIKNASGYALPGQTTYIMGSSGAGKTSLLNIISDRVNLKTGNKLEGDVFINDKHRVTQKLFGTIAGFVMQDDILF